MTFKSKCGLALICAAIMLLALLPAAALADGGFDDVAEDAWYAEDVQYAVRPVRAGRPHHPGPAGHRALPAGGLPRDHRRQL